MTHRIVYEAYPGQFDEMKDELAAAGATRKKPDTHGTHPAGSLQQGRISATQDCGPGSTKNDTPPSREDLIRALAALAQTSREAILQQNNDLLRAKTALHQIIEISAGPIRRIARQGLGE